MASGWQGAGDYAVPNVEGIENKTGFLTGRKP